MTTILVGYEAADPFYYLINHGPIVLITSGDGKKANVAPIAWTMPVSDEPPMLAISCYRKHLTTELIRKTKEFVVNVPGAPLLKAVQACGSVSGRKADKFKKAGLTPVPGLKVKTPHIGEALGFLECRVVNTVKAAEEVIFIGRVAAAYAKKGMLDKGVWSVKAPTVHHLGGGTFALTGKRIKA